MTQTDEIIDFKIKNIFESGKYVIPIYQRNYTWKEGQIVQLLLDINDFSKNDKPQNYYIGTLVVYKRQVENEIIYETIDGQQRLTTLSILYSVLKNEYSVTHLLTTFQKNILDFENRILSSNALNMAFNGKFHSSSKFNTDIEDAYKVIRKELISLFGKEIEANKGLERFINYLNDYVVLLRVEVPKETDLNHYFEIMNNRGEQLEKHEVLKSLLLSYLEKIENLSERENSKELFNVIWEGSAQMERYIQYAFPNDQRSQIFGNQWDEFLVANFDDLLSKVSFTSKSKEIIENEVENKDKGISILDIIGNSKYADRLGDGHSETSERFNTIINFQNFLLHCLLIITEKRESTLDDKKLISNFEFLKDLDDNEKIDFVKKYAFSILKIKYLLDQYVIKREYVNNKESWSLKKLHLYNNKSQSYINTFGKEDTDTESREIIWLLSMFHTVAPNMMYKQWLNATLKYLHNSFTIEDQIIADDYKKYLEIFAKNLIFKRFLAVKSQDYFELIYIDDLTTEIDLLEINWQKLKYYQIENNLIFNFIDYLIIKEVLNENNFGIPSISTFVKNFEFSFRSSVEHYFPQNPKDKGNEITNPELLHSIGNLTLISHSKNSSMNNYLPKAKKEHYKNGMEADSVKQYLMFNKYPDATWGEQDIANHELEILDLLKRQLIINN